MGGHGGLNILPQKRWNVYGRENRLKVARDEEKYDAEQKELREKHEAAEREFRRKMLLDRARQRYEAPEAIEDAGAQHGLLPPPYLGAGTGPGAEVELDIEALQSLTGSRQGQEAGGLAAGRGKREEDGRRERKGERRREREARGPDGSDRAAAAAPAGGGGGSRGPSLAQLAQQLERGPSGGAAVAASAAAAAAALPLGPVFEPERLEHVNLFADEERKARNPEAEAEKKDERRRRGNPETQTSDAKFDEKFKLGYGLAGKEALPWYAKHAATLPGSAIEHLEAPSSHTAQLDQWRHAGRAALAASTAERAGEAAAAGRPEGAASAQAAGTPLLLGRISATEGVAAAAVGEKGGRGKDRKKRNRRRSSSSSSSDDSSSSDSDSDTSEDRKRRRRRSEKKRRKERRKGSGGSKDKKMKKLVALEQLRQERYEREAAERRRQEQLLKSHLAAAREGEPEGRRYHAGFGARRR